MAEEKNTQFNYLLNAVMHAAQEAHPAKAGYAGKYKALIAHVRDLERKAALADEYMAWIDCYHRGDDDYTGFLRKRMPKETTDGVPTVHPTDESWVKCLRETATHLRENSLSLAKYPGMGDEARARELAALYIAEIADLHEAKVRIAALGVKGLDDAQA